MDHVGDVCEAFPMVSYQKPPTHPITPPRASSQDIFFSNFCSEKSVPAEGLVYS